jgi:hypothetical protein
MSSSLNMNSNKITGLANGMSSTDAMAFGQCHVFQIVSATNTTSTLTTSSSFVPTSLTATITPTSSSSKILVLAQGGVDTLNAGISDYVSIFRGSTNLGDSRYGLGTLNGISSRILFPVSLMAYDSPATTSATTYTVEIASEGNHTFAWGFGSAIQTIVLIEVQ